MNQNQSLRGHLLWLLREGNAHLTFDQAIEGIPVELRGAKPSGITHTPWRLLAHMRICQWDILEFSRNDQHVSPDFPDGYWPTTDGPPDQAAWDRSVQAFLSDRQAMMDLVADPSTDLFTPLAHGQGQSILHEALLVADHNAYHLGQLVMVRRAIGC
jgi:hypothetical protein